MNHFKLFLGHFFDWNKKEFFTIIAFNIAFGLLFQLFNLYDFIEVLTVIALGTRSLYFIQHSSLSPSGKATHSSFSWKYIQSMPIGRKSIIMVFSAMKVISSIPFLIWSISFFPLVIQFFNVGDEVTISGVVRVYLSAFILIFLVGMGAINQAVTFPRKQFQDRFAKERMIKYIRVFSLAVVVAMYFGIIGYLIDEHYNINIFVVFKFISEWFEFIFRSWLLPILMLAITFYSYRRTLSVWNNEESSYYKRIKINQRSEFLIIGVCMLLAAIPLMSVDMVTPLKYRGHQILSCAYNNDIVCLKQFEKDSTALKFHNTHGFDAHLVAINEGHLDALKVLNKMRPIDHEAEVSFLNNKDKKRWNALALAISMRDLSMTKYLLDNGASLHLALTAKLVSPLHLAANRCDWKIIDFLIQRGADLEARESNGETPLHYAAEKKCSIGIVLLRDAGAMLEAKDKFGNTPLEKLVKNKHIKSFSYHYLLKLTSGSK
ncbi:MAG: ankyrin repeat domain-containing protein [Bacteriovoracaceae bacterium]|nr:ankyrin repeat domain-containing protein [Bacteriovoracaceae bacterium]